MNSISAVKQIELTLIRVPKRIISARLQRDVIAAGMSISVACGVAVAATATPVRKEMSIFAPVLKSSQATFDTADLAIEALVTALRANDETRLGAILGSKGNRLISSGDTVADAQNRERFLRAYDASNKLVLSGLGGMGGKTHAQLFIGSDAWPLPIPVVELVVGQWRFDTTSGEAEILARRVGANELAAIQVCLAIVDAQREFTRRDADGDGLREYASRFVSAPSKRDGLFYPTTDDEAPSPLGPLVAAAAKEGYSKAGASTLSPYHGYYYKILTEQGVHAPGGAYRYYVKGKMLAGFALLAYPARYGASGVMSFIVSQDGVVHQKNLGANTAAMAARYTTFNPDRTWTRTPTVVSSPPLTSAPVPPVPSAQPVAPRAAP
jgi:hypothetical protein